MKRVVIISDLHCGHMGGLTPPGQMFSTDDSDRVRKKFSKFQRTLWDFYSRNLAELQPVDIAIVVGDAIDGQGEKSGGTEQITTDRYEQVKMAAECIDQAKAKTVVMVHGTPYHTGDEEDWEAVLAGQLKAGDVKVGGHEWYDVNGLVFDVRHQVSRSVIPYGRATPLMRDVVWSMLWSELAGYPNSDVIVRAHVHYYVYVEFMGKVAVICPALQGFTKCGTRRATGTIDIGFLHFDIEDRNTWAFGKHLLNLKQVASHALKL